MKRILFICHGNICRSPMAEYIFLDLVQKARRGAAYAAASAATSTEELGNPVYPPAKRVLRAMGIDCSGKRTRQMTRRDYADYDLLIGMDRWNIRNILRITGGDPDGKVKLLLDYAGGGEVDDPWYTDDFETARRDIERGCRALLMALEAER